jgi:DMSO/TMAO reductase YedYZ heme-binding membrane subunit
MPVLFGLGWCPSTGIGVDVADQFTVFGGAGAALFMLLSCLVLARFAPTRRQVA